MFGNMATTQVCHAHRDREVNNAPRSVVPQRCVHGGPGRRQPLTPNDSVKSRRRSVTLILSWLPGAGPREPAIILTPLRRVPPKLVSSLKSLATRARTADTRSRRDRRVDPLRYHRPLSDGDEVSLGMLNSIKLLQSFNLNGCASLPVGQERRKHCR